MIPHFYESTIGENWFDYASFYTNAVKLASDNSHFVEVGSWKGRSSCFMAVEIANSKKNIQFDCVDSWSVHTDTAEYWIPYTSSNQEDLYQIFLQNIEPVKAYINPIRSLSWKAASRYQDKSLDFVFIDAAHDYDSVKKDLINWYPKVKSNGIISGHDYFNQRCDVKKAVDEYFSKINCEVLFSEDKCWYVTK